MRWPQPRLGASNSSFRGRAGKDCAAGTRALVAKANGRTADLVPIFERLDPDGSLSLNELARRLTAEGLPTISGSAAHVVYRPFRRQRACEVAENVGRHALLHTW